MSEPWWKRVVSDLSGAPDFVPLLGIRPEHIDAGEARFAWEPPAVVRTPGGWVQGGFQGVVLDMVQTFAVFSKLPEGAVPMTLELKVSYLDTAFAERFVVTGRALRVGRTAAHTEGRIEDGDGKLIATSTSTHVIRRPR